MKTHISTFLGSIAIFLLFGELNASGIELSGPSRFTPRLVHSLPAGPDTHGHPTTEVRYGDTFISLWLDSRDRTKVVRADYQDNHSPDQNFIVRNDFFVKLVNVGDWKVVGYLRTNNKLFGVRAPVPRPRPNDLEPSPSRWFIIHMGRAYKVMINPATKRVEDISLVPQNIHEKPENQVGLKVTLRNLGNVHFILYYNDIRGVLGAELNPVYHQP